MYVLRLPPLEPLLIINHSKSNLSFGNADFHSKSTRQRSRPTPRRRPKMLINAHGMGLRSMMNEPRTHSITKNSTVHWRIQGGRQERAPPLGVQILSFSCSFRQKKLKNNSTFGSWRTPLGKILDPPLVPTSSRVCCDLYDDITPIR